MTTPSKDTFREIIKRLLFPLFPGTSFDNPEEVARPSRNVDNLVTQAAGGGSKLKLMPTNDCQYCLQVTRPQVFTYPERDIIKKFLELSSRLYDDYESIYFPDTASSVMSDLVSKTLGSEPFIYKVISSLGAWSQQTYEGQNISVAIG